MPSEVIALRAAWNTSIRMGGLKGSGRSWTNRWSSCGKRRLLRFKREQRRCLLDVTTNFVQKLSPQQLLISALSGRFIIVIIVIGSALLVGCYTHGGRGSVQCMAVWLGVHVCLCVCVCRALSGVGGGGVSCLVLSMDLTNKSDAPSGRSGGEMSVHLQLTTRLI